MKKESPEEKRQRLLGLARESLSTAYSGNEHSIAQAIASYNELEKTRNLVHEKLEEWYGIFFPELRLANQVTYAKFIAEFGADKKAMDAEKLSALLGGAAEAVSRQASTSIGRDPTPEEYDQLRSLASLELSIADAEAGLDRYLESSAKKLMPNITYLVDYKVAAELLGRAGSLIKLANMPSGTIQLLGAEKALFKHIKFGTKPPKYGTLFKLQQVGGAGRWDRGRIARIYATKIAIAARADAISKNFIADKLKEQIDRVVSIQRPERRPADQGAQQRPQRQGYGHWRAQGGQGRDQGQRPRRSGPRRYNRR